MDYYFVNPHATPNFAQSNHHNMIPNSSSHHEFIQQLSDYLMFDDICVDHHHDQESRTQSTNESLEKVTSQSTESFEKVTFSDASQGFNDATSKNNNMYFSSPFICFPPVHLN
jgi:hypothetical protein